MIRGVSTLYRAGGSMLHNITHRNQHWRQGGQLFCAFCMSAWRKADPIKSFESNPYFDKYKDKLKEKQREAPEEFQAKVAELGEQKEQEKEAAAIDEEEVKSSSSQVRQKELDKVLKLDLIRGKTAEEIGQIWSEFHRTKPVIFAVIPADEYKELNKRSTEFPMFIYPIPRGDGYEFFLQKFSKNEVFFTPLIAYQQHKENAPPCLTLTHYTELMDDKGIVLMAGEPDTNILSIPESQLLALQVKLYYGRGSSTKFDLVRQMNNAPDTFQYMDLVQEFQGLLNDIQGTKTVA